MPHAQAAVTPSPDPTIWQSAVDDQDVRRLRPPPIGIGPTSGPKCEDTGPVWAHCPAGVLAPLSGGEGDKIR